MSKPKLDGKFALIWFHIQNFVVGLATWVLFLMKCGEKRSGLTKDEIPWNNANVPTTTFSVMAKQKKKERNFFAVDNDCWHAYDMLQSPIACASFPRRAAHVFIHGSGGLHSSLLGFHNSWCGFITWSLSDDDGCRNGAVVGRAYMIDRARPGQWCTAGETTVISLDVDLQSVMNIGGARIAMTLLCKGYYCRGITTIDSKDACTLFRWTCWSNCCLCQTLLPAVCFRS